MRESYLEAYQGGEGELVEKKSRFIATVRPVKSETEAAAFIEEMRKKYWNASHNCTALCIGRQNELTRCSDDGEPGGTAGRPMLDVLLGGGIHNVCVVVTRYFGGTLLGTGGLVRAYGAAAKLALEAAGLVRCEPARLYALAVDYASWQRVEAFLQSSGCEQKKVGFSDRVDVQFAAPLALCEALPKRLSELLGQPPSLLLLTSISSNNPLKLYSLSVPCAEASMFINTFSSVSLRFSS